MLFKAGTLFSFNGIANISDSYLILSIELDIKIA